MCPRSAGSVRARSAAAEQSSRTARWLRSVRGAAPLGTGDLWGGIYADSSNWPGGSTLVLPVNWITHLEWGTMQIFLRVPAAEVRSRPTLDTSLALRPEVESVLVQEIAGER